MRQKNFTRLDGLIGESNLQKFDKEFAKLVDIALKEMLFKTDGFGHPERTQKKYKEAIEAMIEIRRYLLAELIEMWGSWHDKGDCFPTMIQLGKNSKNFASVIIEEE